MGAETFYEYFENFGLTEPTGIDFPGEADSNYHSMERLRDEGSGRTWPPAPLARPLR